MRIILSPDEMCIRDRVKSSMAWARLVSVIQHTHTWAPLR